MLKIAYILIFISISQISTATSRSAPWVGITFDGLPCTGNPQGYGPFDYTKPSERKKMPIVESRHFTSKVENLISGEGHVGEGASGVDELPNDLDYTLRAIPNHHRALKSIVRYQIQFNLKDFKVPLITPVECYMQRAINFSPKDAGTHSLYAFYLRKVKKWAKAEEHYKLALKIIPNSAKIHYSYSLLLIKLKRYDQALTEAKKAYAQGKPPNTLRKKLIKLGVWKNQENN